MSKIELHEVEFLTENNILSRVAVPGGWMYRVWDIIVNPSEDTAYAALCFVPDPNAPHVRDDRRLKWRDGFRGVPMRKASGERYIRESDDRTIIQQNFSTGTFTAFHADWSFTRHASLLEAHDALIVSGSESPFVAVTGPAVKAEEVTP